MSSDVKALLKPPTSSVSRSIVSGAVREVPLNIKCSKRCAKPERPGGSSLPPTRYAMLIATDGTRRSATRMVSRRLGGGWWEEAEGAQAVGEGVIGVAEGRHVDRRGGDRR